jgi:hypothetical protein
MNSVKPNPIYKWTIIIGLVLFLVISVAYVIIGRVNSDEGWYLYTSKLVYGGAVPYQDFSFTQTPLLPYIYGLPQVLFSPGLYLGRVTSVLLTAISFLLSIVIANRLGGEKAAAATALIWATFTSGIYFLIIVKTYALTTLFFMLVFYILTREGKSRARYALAVLFALLATLTRLSALFFAIPVIIYTLLESDTKTRLIITGLCLATSTILMGIVLPNPESAYWGLLGNHMAEWGNMTVGERLLLIIQTRIPKLAGRYVNYLLFWCGLLVMGFKRIVTTLRNSPGIRVVIFGLFLFVIPNLTSGFMLTEYFIPFLFLLIPIAGIIFGKMVSNPPGYQTTLLHMLIAGVAISGLFWRSTTHMDISGEKLPVEEIIDAANVVKANTGPTDEIYVMEALTVVVEAKRQAMPGMTLAQFSLFEGDSDTARHLHLVNSQMTLDYFEQGVPKLVILTSFDWASLRKTAEYDRIVTALNQNYQRIYSAKNFGQNMNQIDVFVLTEGWE